MYDYTELLFIKLVFTSAWLAVTIWAAVGVFKLRRRVTSLEESLSWFQSQSKAPGASRINDQPAGRTWDITDHKPTRPAPSPRSTSA